MLELIFVNSINYKYIGGLGMTKSFSLKKKLIMALVLVLLLAFEPIVPIGGDLVVGLFSGEMAQEIATAVVYTITFLISGLDVSRCFKIRLESLLETYLA